MKRKKSNDGENKNLDKRLKILSSYEYKEYYSLPNFSDEERKQLFEFDEDEQYYIDTLKSNNSKLSAMLQIVYFKTKRRFFNMDINNPIIKSDVQYLINNFFQNILKFKDFNFSPVTLVRQRKEVINLFGYKESENFINEINQKARNVASIDASPKYIFGEIWRYVSLIKVILPSYKDLQLIISKAINDEEKRILSLMNKLLDKDIIHDLENLTTKENEGKVRYLISFLRSPTKELSYSEVYEEISKQKILKKIYEKSKQIFEQLKISNNTIKYFANFLETFDVHDLKKFKQNKRLFILLCFAHHKYLTITDNLVYTFIQILEKKLKEVDYEVNEIIKTKNIANYNNYNKIPKILRLVLQEKKPEKTEDFIKQAFSILNEVELKSLINYMEKNYEDKDEIIWKEMDKKYEVIKRNLKYIFQELDFTQNSSDKFIEAVNFLKEEFANKNKDFAEAPIDFIPKNQQKHFWQPREVTVRREINPKRYEMLVYRVLKEKIKAEDIILKDSFSYKKLDDYLIDEKYFHDNFENIIKALSLDRLENFEAYLDYNCNQVETLFKQVNENILSGKNKYYKQVEKTFSPKYEVSQETIPRYDIFSNFTIIHLTDLLQIVNEDTDFLSQFTHISERYQKSLLNPKVILAVLIAHGTNFGIKRMATSSEFTISKLRGASENFFREDTLKQANQIINDKAAQLKAFNYFNISENVIHSSSDGQRFPVSGKIFKANHSKKHFGKGKGLSTVSIHANYQPLELKVISSGEYEGYYTLELLLMNQSNIKPTIHSTDTHGLTDINFVLMALSGFDFAPRIANTMEKLNKLVGVMPVNNYPENWPIKPTKRINKELILSEKHNIFKVIVSLVLKTGSVSTIVKKLCNSKKRHNRLIRALSEFDKLIRTNHILKFIDIPEYRKEIGVSLNRGEEYHNMARHVDFGNLGKIKAKSEMKQNTYQQCNRLICNCIIYYNCYILSRIIEEKEKLQDFEYIEKLKKVSPISWQHINFFGKYDFGDDYFGKEDFEMEFKDKFLKIDVLNIDE